MVPLTAVLTFCFLLASVLVQTLLPQIAHSFSTSDNVTFDDVSFILYTHTTNATELHRSNLDLIKSSKPTIFITHGWESEFNTSWVINMATTFVQEDDCNVITVDWSNLAAMFYPLSVGVTSGVGKVVSELITYLNYTLGVNLDDVHLVGHSLGAHVSGFAGRDVKRRFGYSVGRITGLDPAGPLFAIGDTSTLNKEDAQLVVSIHTDAGALGILGTSGHIDFFPNGGTPPQPGCMDITTGCSHGRSTEIFTEAVGNKNSFLSWECENYLVYKLELCKNNRQVTIGGALTLQDSGQYYLFTNSKSPFSKN